MWDDTLSALRLVIARGEDRGHALTPTSVWLLNQAADELSGIREALWNMIALAEPHFTDDVERLAIDLAREALGDWRPADTKVQDEA